MTGSLLFVVLSLICLPIRGDATSIVAEISPSTLTIPTSFKSQDILIFGSLKQKGIDSLTIEILGPSQLISVQQFMHKKGIWLKGKQEYLSGVPGLYIKAQTPLPPSSHRTEETSLLSLPLLYKNQPLTKDKQALFTKLLKRHHLILSSPKPATIEVIDQELFKMLFTLPPQAPLGHYTVRISAPNNNTPPSVLSFELKRSGFLAFIHQFSKDHSLLYAFLCIFIALSMGILPNFILKKR